MKILVAYYSKTGNTKKVALELAKILKADIDEIIDLKNRSGLIGWLKGGRDAMKEVLTDIKTSKDPSKYDLVILGTPIWAWNATPAARSYVAEYKDKIKKMALFTTSGSDGPEKPVAYLEKVAGRRCSAFAGWNTADLKNTVIYQQKFDQFVKNIKS